MDLDRELIVLEEGFWRAAGDAQRYEVNLAADAVHILPGWGIAERAPVLAAVGDADPWNEFSLDDIGVIRLGENAAAVVYTARAERSGQDAYVAAITSVYRRGAEGWKLAIHQQTPLQVS